MNLIALSKSLSQNAKDKSIQDVYKSLIPTMNKMGFLNKVTPLDVIKIIFLIQAINDGKDPKKELDFINTFLYIFTIIDFESSTAQISCSECSGDGYISCDYCDMSGKIECEECDGSGEDDEGNTCDNCDGDGQVTCDTCGGDGDLTCSECSGSGEIDSDDLYAYTLYTYVSYNTELYDLLKKYLDEVLDLTDQDFLSYGKTILINTDDQYPSSESDTDFEIDSNFAGSSYVNNVLEKDEDDFEFSNGQIQLSTSNTYPNEQFKP
jgi:hypothetical protein